MKTKIVMYLLVFTVTLAVLPSAWATWNGFLTLGKNTVTGQPVCVPNGTGSAICVARSQTSTLMWNKFASHAWSGWTNLAGVVTSDPSCALDNAGKIVCGALGSTNALVATVFDGANWSALKNVGGQLSSSPSCATLTQGQVFCAAKNLTGTLTGTVFNGTAWSAFVNAPAASLTSGPGCAYDNDGSVICSANAIVGTAQSIQANRFSASTKHWDVFIETKGLGADRPMCTDMGLQGQVYCFVRATNTVIYGNHFKGGTWTSTNWGGWGSLTSNTASKTSCGVQVAAAGSLVCGFLNLSDSIMYANTFNGVSWTGYVKIGTKPIITPPACTSIENSQVVCVVVSVNNQASSATGP